MPQLIDQSSILHEIDIAKGYDSEGGFKYYIVNGTKTKVYTKYLTGTTDADTQTNITHGVDYDKILSAVVKVKSSTGNYFVYDFKTVSGSAASTYQFEISSVDLILYFVGSNLQSKTYMAEVSYYL